MSSKTAFRGTNRWLPLAFAVLWSSPSGHAASDAYLLRLQKSVANARSHTAALTKTAERAAEEFVAGGNLWVTGRQEDFIAEACGRAGGLMAIASLGQRVPTNHDVILYAVAGALTRDDLRVINRWQEQGVTVIKFGSSDGLYREHFPLDTVANVVDLWTWTGEFVAACTRLGKMPVLYQSYGLPGGPERGKKYQGKKFHDDLTIKPIAAGVLGREYLEQVGRLLARLSNTQLPKMLKGAHWWREAASATILVTGHMFPRHAQDPRAPSFGTLAAVPAWEEKDVLDPSHPPNFVLCLGYQYAPRRLLEQAKAMDLKLVYTTVQSAQPPEPSANFLYLDPGWPLADGCVDVPGYDIPILPASGVVQAAIYWTIASERGS